MELKENNAQLVIDGKHWRNFQLIPHTVHLKAVAIADVKNVTESKLKSEDGKNHESLRFSRRPQHFPRPI